MVMGDKTFMSKLKYANGNKPLTDKEKQKMIEEASLHYGRYMDALNIDWRNDPNSSNTPKRVARAFVNDLAEIVAHFVKNPTSGIFNLSTGQSLRLLAIIKLISKFLGVEAKIHNIECNHSRDDLRIVNKKLLSYMPRAPLTSMTVGIKNYINEN